MKIDINAEHESTLILIMFVWECTHRPTVKTETVISFKVDGPFYLKRLITTFELKTNKQKKKQTNKQGKYKTKEKENKEQ